MRRCAALWVALGLLWALGYIAALCWTGRRYQGDLQKLFRDQRYLLPSVDPLREIADDDPTRNLRLLQRQLPRAFAYDANTAAFINHLEVLVKDGILSADAHASQMSTYALWLEEMRGKFRQLRFWEDPEAIALAYLATTFYDDVETQTGAVVDTRLEEQVLEVRLRANIVLMDRGLDPSRRLGQKIAEYRRREAFYANEVAEYKRRVRAHDQSLMRRQAERAAKDPGRGVTQTTSSQGVNEYSNTDAFQDPALRISR